MLIKLGEQMRYLRLKEGRTQEELAEALGVTSQAVSRWEKGICYPDMELIPSVANFFGVSIDELFGYSNEREKKIDDIAEKIQAMNRRNNGEDVCMDECISFARECMAEFPGNEKIMLCLASVLYNAGYVRHGEHHVTDDDGYDIYDTERHRKYPEWTEAIKLYEKLLATAGVGEIRYQASRELLQLYINVGETEKALAVSESAPDISGCCEFLKLNTCDGRGRAVAYAETMLNMITVCADLMISCVISNRDHISPEDAVRSVRNAISMYDLVCTDGNYGMCCGHLACMHLYLSERLWLADDRDGAFEALDKALELAKEAEKICALEEVSYTAPLLKLVKAAPDKNSAAGTVKALPEYWPWWFDHAYSKVADEIKADPRWTSWVNKTLE